MSWELESAQRPGFNRAAGSLWQVFGLALGLMTISNGVAFFYWLFAWVAPLMLAGALVLASLLAGRHARRVVDVADGALAAALFAAVFAVIALLVLAN